VELALFNTTYPVIGRILQIKKNGLIKAAAAMDVVTRI